MKADEKEINQDRKTEGMRTRKNKARGGRGRGGGRRRRRGRKK